MALGAVLALTVIGSGLWFWKKPGQAASTTSHVEHYAVQDTETGPTQPERRSDSPVSAASTHAEAKIRPSGNELPDVTPATRDLVVSLTSAPAGELSRDQVAAWKHNYRALVERGSAGAAAIREYLKQNVDFGFGATNGAALGYPTARSAMLDALGRIATPEAIKVLDETLRVTADPREIAWVTRNLEKLEPGQHTTTALAAASEALSMGSAGNLGDRDLAPAFEVMQTYGNTVTAVELETAAKKWGYYAANALANLPEGAGVASLTRLAEPSDPNRTIALQMLAQVAATNPDARKFLVETVRDGGVPDRLWAYLSSPLRGERYFFVDSVISQFPSVSEGGDIKTVHSPESNQNLYILPADDMKTAKGISRQLTLIDDMLAVATNATARTVLQRTRDSLARMKPQPPTDPQ